MNAIYTYISYANTCNRFCSRTGDQKVCKCKQVRDNSIPFSKPKKLEASFENRKLWPLFRSDLRRFAAFFFSSTGSACDGADYRAMNRSPRREVEANAELVRALALLALLPTVLCSMEYEPGPT